MSADAPADAAEEFVCASRFGLEHVFRATLALVGLAGAAGFQVFFGSMDVRPACVVPLVSGFFGLVFAWYAYRSVREFSLTRPARGKDLVLTDTELRISLSVLGGATASALRARGEAYLTVPWADIVEFRVVPGNTYGASCYRLLASSLADAVYIYRSFFRGREAELLDRFRRRLTCPVILEDTLR